tara:strand:- start:1278 stop:1637 length:360 start_codon:yes stop_codon:yes gene_type:complete
MKKILLALLILTGCAKDYSEIDNDLIIADLQIEGNLGLKFYNNNTITDTDLFNIKSPINTIYTLEVKDIFDNIVTKSTLEAKAGDNVYAFYTNAFKNGHYTISVYHDGELIAETKQTIL